MFAKSSNKCYEFLNILGFSKIALDFHVFFFIFISTFLEHSRKIQKTQKILRKILDNLRKLKNHEIYQSSMRKLDFLEFSRK